MSVADDRIGAINGAAGAGFRLSLVLNAVKMKMQNADDEIQRISRGISDFSLMLKLVGRTMEEGAVIPTPLAIDTVFDIKDHSERVFEEIKSMTELEQVRDANGIITDIQLGRKVVWCFKKQKVPYLLGQLDYLKLSLAIMLQILQLAKVVSPMKPRPSDKYMTQESAEVSNMIVLQHWSYEELRNLYVVASAEVKRDRQSSISSISEDPPPRYDDPGAETVRLAITPPPVPPKEEDTSQAIVRYQEKPLQQLDEAIHQALSRENQVLSASVPDIVGHLLREWTQPEWPEQPEHPNARALKHGKPSRSSKYRPRVSDHESDTTESEYDSTNHPRGYYLESPKTDGRRKNVRFKNQQAKVEDDIDEEEHRPRRHTKHHILNSNEDSSDSDLSPAQPAQERLHRHDSNTSSNGSRYGAPSQARTRRPYTTGPSGPRNSPPEKETIRPGPSRGIPPSPRTGSVPITQHNQPWFPQSPGLRPPGLAKYPGPQPGGPQRRPSGTHPYIPQQYLPSPSASPVAIHGQYFPQQQQQRQGPTPQQGPSPTYGVRERPPPKTRASHGSRPSSERAVRDKKEASRNIKKGLGIGAAAAGLFEILSGLDGI